MSQNLERAVHVLNHQIVPFVLVLFSAGMFTTLFFLHKEEIQLHGTPQFTGYGILGLFFFAALAFVHYHAENNIMAMCLTVLSMFFAVGCHFFY